MKWTGNQLPWVHLADVHYNVGCDGDDCVVVVLSAFEMRWCGTALFQEEFEDSAGNVVTKKTYEDLRRQGLLWSWW